MVHRDFLLSHEKQYLIVLVVKLEIAKGVLPFSRFFAGNTTTLFAKSWAKFHPRNPQAEEELEESPTAALFLHWIFSVLLIVFTSRETVVVAYQILVYLYTYTIVLLVSFFISNGLLCLRFRDAGAWREISGYFRPWGCLQQHCLLGKNDVGSFSSAPRMLTCTSFVTGFLLIASFVPPANDSPFSYSAQMFEWFIVPTVSLGGLLIGGAYFVVLRHIIPQVTGKRLVIDRVPIIVSDDHGGFVQTDEVIEFLRVVPGLLSDDKR